MKESFNINENTKAFENIDRVNALFRDICLEHNLTDVPSAPLLAADDETLLYTNSSMAPFKQIIDTNGIPKNGLFIIQECLRSNDQHLLFINESDLQWQSYFYMLGCIVDKQDFQKLVTIVSSHLSSMKIEINSVIVKSSSRFNYLSNSGISFDDFSVLQDTEPEDYYKWKYGMEAVLGEGVTFALIHDGQEYDIGNIICFIKDNEIIGWESAFGSEVLVAASKKISPFETSVICDVLKYEDSPDFRKFADSLMSTIEIINIGVLPSNKKEGFILRKYIKALINFLQIFIEYDINTLIIKYCSIKGYDSNKVLEVLGNEIRRFSDSKVRNVKAFTSFYKKNFKNSQDTDWFRVAYESFSLNESEARSIMLEINNNYD